MTDLPAPPVPADADLRHYPDMPLEVARLRDCSIVLADAEVFRCAMLLWCASWHQVPAGSLADDDAELCRMVGLGRDLRTWRRIRDAALRGWEPFSDGRLYHRTVCEKVIEGLNSTALYRWGKACGRTRKENFRRRKARLDVLPTPDRPQPHVLAWPVAVTEREFSPERKGKESFPMGTVNGCPSGTGNDHLAVAASAEGLDGLPPRDGMQSEVQTAIAKLAAGARLPA